MFLSRLNFKLATLLVASFFISTSSYGVIRLAVSPPATWSGDAVNGTARTMSNVMPSDFKEDEEVVTGFGSYSNRVMSRGIQQRYKLRIRIDGNLISSSGKTIPYTNLKYIFTYTNGVGTKYNFSQYVPFSMSNQDLYLCTTAEAPFPENASAELECQLKYAVQVPNDQAPGTYTATIYYRMEEVEGGSPENLERTCQVNVVVGNYFRLSVDRGSLDFAKMNPGETKDNVPVEGVIATAMTNTGNPWYLKISNDTPLSSGPYVISNSNFIWYGWTNGAGRWYGNGTDTLNFAPNLIYASGAGEENNLPNGTKNHLKFKLTIPKGTPGGKYLSNVKLTLTE